MSLPPALGPFLAGLRGRCPNCGVGRLFAGFLAVQARCSSCGFDLRNYDNGDGPAVFVITLVGFVIVFGCLIMQIALNPPVWVALGLWLPIGAALCLALLRPMKGLMIAAQIRNRTGGGG